MVIDDLKKRKFISKYTVNGSHLQANVASAVLTTCSTLSFHRGHGAQVAATTHTERRKETKTLDEIYKGRAFSTGLILLPEFYH